MELLKVPSSGPILFNIYITDLPKIMDKLSFTILYANDTNIIVTSTNYKDLQKEVNLTLQLISELFQINWLVLNKNKTSVIFFSLTITLTHKILDNQNLTLRESIKFFGMHLSRKLHTEKLLKILITACYMMNLYYYLTLDSLKTVYFAHIQSWSQFGIIL